MNDMIFCQHDETLYDSVCDVYIFWLLLNVPTLAYDEMITIAASVILSSKSLPLGGL